MTDCDDPSTLIWDACLEVIILSLLYVLASLILSNCASIITFVAAHVLDCTLSTLEREGFWSMQ